jgi:polyisoprenoid-binding protein YceI
MMVPPVLSPLEAFVFRPTSLVVVMVLALSAPALAADFALDTNHTQAEFTVVHLGFSQVRGQIPLIAGTLSVGATDVPTAVTATLSAKDIDSHSADRDRDLRGADWLEVDKFPTMTFVATQITGTPQSFTVVGNLTMHGVTKPVTLAAKEEGKMSDARGHTHIAYTATGTIDRRDWGLNWGKTTPGGSLIAGYDVTLGLNIEAVSK